MSDVISEVVLGSFWLMSWPRAQPLGQSISLKGHSLSTVPASQPTISDFPQISQADKTFHADSKKLNFIEIG